MLDDLEPANTRAGRRGPILIVIFAVFVAVIIGASILVLNASPPAASQPTAMATVVLPSLALGQKSLFDIRGNSATNSNKFVVAGNWDLYWAYDCTQFSQGNFTVYIYEDSRLSFETGSVTQFGAKGSDVVHYHNGGTYYVQVISSCAWNLKGVNL